ICARVSHSGSVCTTYQRSPSARDAASPSAALGPVDMLHSNPSPRRGRSIALNHAMAAPVSGKCAPATARMASSGADASAPTDDKGQTSVPLRDGGRLYVIGDIHGRSDLLDRLTDAIAGDLKAAPADGCLTVTIGDYIDRGPDSRGVLDRLARNPFPTEF